MSIVVVGSVAFDSVKTPLGEAKKVLGGAANYFSMAAHFFSPVKLVGVVGEDFPETHIDYLKSRKICTKGLERASGKTFYWRGEYGDDLNEARTVATHLNVFESFKPRLPKDYQNMSHVFLANIDPTLQGHVLDQVECPEVVVADTMNYWIDGKCDELKKTLGRVDIAMLNEAEAKKLSGETHVIRAAKKIRELGPKIVVIKRGEYGALLDNGGKICVIPAYPLAQVKDPTGAGDTFAGGFLGFLVKNGEPFHDSTLRRALAYGTVMASFNIEDFSFYRLTQINWGHIEERYRDFLSVLSLEGGKVC